VAVERHRRRGLKLQQCDEYEIREMSAGEKNVRVNWCCKNAQ
jgi:hypothetical protein